MLSTRRVRIGAAALAALAVLAWGGWWWLHRLSASNHAAVGVVTNAAAEARSDRAGPGPTTRASPIVPQPFHEAEEPESRSGALDWWLRVTLAPDDKPAAGATVEVVTLTREEVWSRFQTDVFNTPGPNGQRSVTKLVAGPSGEVNLPAFSEYARVRAWLGSFRGEADLRASDEPRPFTLRLESRIAALVLDEGGMPRAGIEVAFNSRNGSLWLADEHQKTGANGFAWFSPHGVLDPWPDSRSGAPEYPKQPPNRLALAIPLARPVTAPIYQDHLPTGPVRLVLPQVGPVTVRLTNTNGSPYVEGAQVTLRAVSSTTLEDPFWYDPASTVDFEVLQDPPEPETFAPVVETATGRAFFPAVGIGMRLVARVRPDDRDLRTTDVVFDGPAADGAETTVDVVCDEHGTTIKGRLLLPNGKPPYTTGAIGVTLAQATAGPLEAWSRTRDSFHAREDGGFETRLGLDPSQAAGASIFFDIRLAYHSGFIARNDPDIVGMEDVVESRLPPAAKDGVFDLGTIVIPELPLLASGVVVDSSGQPVAGASVSIAPGSGHADSPPVTTREDGTFELRGHCASDAPSFALWAGRVSRLYGGPDDARAAGLFCDTAEVVARGARDVRLVLPAAGSLEGSVARFTPEDFESGIRAEVEREGGGGLDAARLRPARLARGILGYEGWLSAGSLCPGTYVLKLLAWGDPAPIFSAGGIVVEAGRTNRDPRIQNIEIGSLLMTRTVIVRDDGGAPVDGARVSVHANGSSDGPGAEHSADIDGRVVFRTSLRPVDITACARGFRSATIRNVEAGEIGITLKRSAPRQVTIRLDPLVTLPDPPIHLGATLRRLVVPEGKTTAVAAPTDASTPFIDRALFGSDRVVTVTVPDPGRYAVELFVLSRTMAFDHGEFVTVDAPRAQASITVGETGKVTVQVGADPAAIAAAVAAALAPR